MKKNLILLFSLFFFVACTQQDEFNELNKTESVTEQEPLSPTEINSIIKNSISTTGGFDWADASDHLLWSATQHGYNILTVGYGDHAFSNHKSTTNKTVKTNILSSIKEMEPASNLKKSETVLIYDDEHLNYIDVHVESIETIKKLRRDPTVRYVEPTGYEFFAEENRYKSSSGCTTSADYVYAADYTVISPNCLQPWTFAKHNIPQAWNYSTGQGITVGLIDTGVSQYQSLLGSNFNDGYSSGRYISKYGTYVDSWWPWSTSTDGYNDKCGHGTSMAATIASPRNDNGLPVGVAYNCNLISYRGTSDVVLDGYHEQKGVANALVGLGNNSSVKVISMSIGHIFSVGSIEDAIRYAYARGKMIVAAGGTSTSFTNFVGVIFPAWMSETVAVTGITDGSGYEECEVCHEGSKIDFTVIMERYYDADRHSVCLGFYENTKDYVGGSSVATATTAGIAALIWAKNPTWTRTQVYEKMKQSASLYPNKSSSFGYGSIDALAAVQ